MSRRRSGSGCSGNPLRPESALRPRELLCQRGRSVLLADPAAARAEHPPLTAYLGPAAERAQALRICSSATFLGDYFGVDSGGGSTYTTSISTYGDAGNPSYYQQQVVSRVKTP